VVRGLAFGCEFGRRNVAGASVDGNRVHRAFPGWTARTIPDP
jgi:hypothetical protein